MRNMMGYVLRGESFHNFPKNLNKSTIFYALLINMFDTSTSRGHILISRKQNHKQEDLLER
jgi:hypothetical protein